MTWRARLADFDCGITVAHMQVPADKNPQKYALTFDLDIVKR
jgi:hypothetical protein